MSVRISCWPCLISDDVLVHECRPVHAARFSVLQEAEVNEAKAKLQDLAGKSYCRAGRIHTVPENAAISPSSSGTNSAERLSLPWSTAKTPADAQVLCY